MYRRFSSYLLLGGAGLVGMATCRLIARELDPSRVVVASLFLHEAEAAVEELRGEFPAVEWVAASGNLFVPTEFAHMGRGELLGDPGIRRKMLDSIFGDFESSYRSNHLATLIREHKPDAIVDCVNTATGISYQDIFDSTATLRQDLDLFRSDDEQGRAVEEFGADLEAGLLSQATPQIIRHVRLLYRATTDVGTAVYVKVGTTGTGGIGLNIPYTHSEDRPSHTLLAKNAVAFAHTGLLFLLARTPDAPVVKEIKPAAMIGYKAVEVRPIPGPDGKPVKLIRPQEADAGLLEELNTREDPSSYEETGENFEIVVVNTGENGLFAKGEFAAITAMSQMEFVTTEEIAQRVVTELSGGNTGNDVIAAMDGAVMTPSYRGGLLRQVAIKDLHRLEQEHAVPSIAIGKLGPPELSKLLFEAYLIQDAFGTEFEAARSDAEGQPLPPEALSQRIAEGLKESVVALQAVSIGIPVLLPDGKRFLRGPTIKVPEIKGKRKVAALDGAATLDKWARRGWIDLRPENMAVWQERFARISAAREKLVTHGSAAVSRETYLPVGIKIGDVVAWIFNTEMEGYRTK